MEGRKEGSSEGRKEGRKEGGLAHSREDGQVSLHRCILGRRCTLAGRTDIVGNEEDLVRR